jgi:hypothetical protein
VKKLYTDLAIKKLKPHPTKRLELPDAGAAGLYVTVQPGSGAKSFVLRFRRPDGRNARMVLGGFDPTPRSAPARRVGGRSEPDLGRGADAGGEGQPSAGGRR